MTTKTHITLWLNSDQELDDLEQLASNNSDSVVAQRILEGIADERAKQAKQAIGELTKGQLKQLRTDLIDLVVNGKPSDVSDAHKEDWFFVDPQGQTCWNWKHSERPLIHLVNKLGLSVQYNNTARHVTCSITESVKKCAAVKPIKARAI